LIDYSEDSLFTIASRHEDRVDWHHGRSHYAVWAIELDIPAAWHLVDSARAHLHARLLPEYSRQPHVTLAICGFPALQQAASGDNYIAERFHRDIADLQSALIEPFCFSTGALFSFAAAASFAIDDSGSLARLRTALTYGRPHVADPAPYVPHLTVGLYRHRVAMQEITSLMAQFKAAPVQLKTGKICLMVYAANVISGPLTTVCQFDLNTSSLDICKPEFLPWLERP
jgi:hypothetical protein